MIEPTLDEYDALMVNCPASLRLLLAHQSAMPWRLSALRYDAAQRAEIERLTRERDDASRSRKLIAVLSDLVSRITKERDEQTHKSEFLLAEDERKNLIRAALVATLRMVRQDIERIFLLDKCSLGQGCGCSQCIAREALARIDAVLETKCRTCSGTGWTAKTAGPSVLEKIPCPDCRKEARDAR